MNNYFDTMSEQLTAYLDGELPSDMHETLFEELARNPQLREEMNEHLLIRSAVQKDNVLPSTRVLDNLLAAVESGDSFVPVAHESSISGLSTVAGKINSLRTLIGGVMALIFGIMAPSVVHESDNTIITAENAQQEVPVNSLAAIQSPPILSTKEKVEQQSLPPKQSSIATAIVSSIHGDEQSLNEVLALQDISDDNSLSVLLTSIETIPVSLYDKSESMISKNTHNSASFMASSSSSLPFIPHDKIAVRYRGMGYNGSGSRNQWFDNMGIGVFYKLGKDHCVGIDINNERPQLAYEGIVDNRQFTYQQNPSFLSVSLAYRFNAGMLKVGDFQPFAELSGGFALPDMPVGRVGTGIQYSPTQAVSLSLGMEYNTLRYQFLGNTYSSNNWGITYGIMINMDSF